MALQRGISLDLGMAELNLTVIYIYAFLVRK